MYNCLDLVRKVFAECSDSRILQCKEGQGQCQQVLMSSPRKGTVRHPRWQRL